MVDYIPKATSSSGVSGSQSQLQTQSPLKSQTASNKKTTP